MTELSAISEQLNTIARTVLCYTARTEPRRSRAR